MDADDIISAPDIEAALAAGDLNRVLHALSVGLAPWGGKACHCCEDAERCSSHHECKCCAAQPGQCQLRSNAAIAQRVLSQLAQRVPAGQLQLARGSEGAMQLLVLLREALHWRHHAAAEAFASFAATHGAPRLRLSWWRTLLQGALPWAVQPQLPALHTVVSLCNEAAAREGQPALPPMHERGAESALSAALNWSTAPFFPALAQVPCQLARAAALPACKACWAARSGLVLPPVLQLPGSLGGSAVADEPACPSATSPIPRPPCLPPSQVLANASGIAEHVRPFDIFTACRFDCVGEVARLGPPPTPAVSQQYWLEVFTWGQRALDTPLRSQQVGRLEGGVGGGS